MHEDFIVAVRSYDSFAYIRAHQHSVEELAKGVAYGPESTKMCETLVCSKVKRQLQKTLRQDE